MIPAKLVEFTLDRYDEAIALWRRTPGICVREADSREALARYLQRNPGLSFLAEADGLVVGSALAGHDGRRGYLQHVAVDTAHRNQGIAQQLVARCVAELARAGIEKVHLEVLATNAEGLAYWERRGWTLRNDICRYSFTAAGKPNA